MLASVKGTGSICLIHITFGSPDARSVEWCSRSYASCQFTRAPNLPSPTGTHRHPPSPSPSPSQSQSPTHPHTRPPPAAHHTNRWPRPVALCSSIDHELPEDLAPISAECGPKFVRIDHICPEPIKVGPNSAEFGPTSASIDPIGADMTSDDPMSTNLGPMSTNIVPKSSDADQHGQGIDNLGP